MSYSELKLEFEGVSGFESTVDTLEERFRAEKRSGSDNKVICMLDDGEEWLTDWDRDPLVVYEDDEPVTASAVSERDKYYTPVQFHEPFTATLDALEETGVVPRGYVTVGKYRKRLTSKIEFEGNAVEDPTGNDVNLGLKINTAHNGFSAVRVEVGAERLICSNGMTAWDSEFSFTHEHNQGPFRADVMHQSIESILGSTDRVKERFEEAHQKRLGSKQEMFLLLLDCGIEWLFEDPIQALEDALQMELSWHDNPERMRDEPSLYDAWMVGTYAIDHLSDEDTSQKAIDNARERVSNMMETYDGDIPDPVEMVQDTVEARTDALTQQESNERWSGEEELVREVAGGI